jgi:predicted nucleic acid-binding protein
MWLWDTNIVGAYSNRNAEGHERVLARADGVGWQYIGLPVVVAAEMLEGRLRYLREAHRRTPRQLVASFQRLEDTLRLLAAFAIVPFNDAALQVYERRSLFAGTMSREDRLIAAIALASAHRLVTRNVGHFSSVPGLVVENWVDEAP